MRKIQFDENTANYTAGTPVGGGTFVIHETDVGYAMGEMTNTHYIYVEGLDGGTYTTKYKGPFGTLRNWRTTGLTEDDITIINEVQVTEIHIILDTLGASAAPVVGLVSELN